jgi:hypothetical protein
MQLLIYEVMLEFMYMQENVASSSSSKVRSSFIGMGFSPSLVDRAIEENGRFAQTNVLILFIGHSRNELAINRNIIFEVNVVNSKFSF